MISAEKKKEVRVKTIIINEADQPELFAQLERIDNKILQKGSRKYHKDEDKIDSKEDYLESLVILDKSVNGDHILNFKEYSRGNSKYEYYSDYRKVCEYSEIPQDYLNYMLLDNIDKMSEAFTELYRKFPLELTNSYLSCTSFTNQSKTLAHSKVFPVNDEEHKFDDWVIPNQDNLSKAYYHFGLVKRISNELVKKGLKTTSIEDTIYITKKDITKELIEAMKDAQSPLDALCGYPPTADESSYCINSEFYYFRNKIIKQKDTLNKKVGLGLLLKVMYFKCDTYLDIGKDSDENFIKRNKTLLKVMLEIAKIFINKYLVELEELSNNIDPFAFNYYLKFIANYYSNHNVNYWVNSEFKEYTNKDLNALKDILEKCKDVTPYARRVYKELYK